MPFSLIFNLCSHLNVPTTLLNTSLLLLLQTSFSLTSLTLQISVEAENFQRGCSVSEVSENEVCSNLISDLEGVVCIANDIIIHGKDGKEHDIRMNKFIKRCGKEGIALNK